MKIIWYILFGLAFLFFLSKFLLFSEPGMEELLPGPTVSALPSSVAAQEAKKILKVPADFPSITQAVDHAREGDWVIISPGKYVENNIKITHPITVSSEWKLSGYLSKIDQTVVDAEDESLFINNLVQDNSLGGFKRFGRNSVIVNNLFYNNGGENFLETHESAVQRGNLIGVDPLLDKSNFIPEVNSPVIDAGVSGFHLKDGGFPEIPSSFILGSAPDIGAVEFKPKE